MAITVTTSEALAPLFAGERRRSGEGGTVGELLDNLNVRARLCNDNGAVRSYYSIHINDGEEIRFLQGLDTPVSDGDTVIILSAISGG